ncbi:hypothetical protein MKX03_013623, partial [Papaver bracteatum]
MGSKENKRKLTDEDKLAKLELKIQYLTYTLAAFMKESVVKRKPMRRKERTNREKEELKEDEDSYPEVEDGVVLTSDVIDILISEETSIEGIPMHQ